MTKRAPLLVAIGVAVPLLLAGCGVSVANGGENAATNPASGIWVSPTVGSENISTKQPAPTPSYKAPGAKTPKVLAAGLQATVTTIRAAIKGGCWQDARTGNIYGAYDQLFWWQGGCNDTVAQVLVELYPDAAAARRAADHSSPDAILGRFSSGAVIVDVYSNAPQSVLADLGTVKGLAAVPGYQG